ncbi:hypothetical protein CEE36_04720 [candidate division TA06 bacterium B3_TA06]|uniref:Uncharacterized protein n=1 Tax=candidate division TA06 bacterium B3_TA06 TaxID=2012487 RepID=A0A532V821_UNCT6|nr:MAG: hypothetical protein CEE36_04720 [candidate division TA06 bacterium B3_TA06]
MTQWGKEGYQCSVTSRAWSYSPYDVEWEKLPASAELQEIFEEEMVLDEVPEWASKIIERMFGPPPCGHYTFPRPVLQVCEAINQERCSEFIYGCYTADSERKTLMSYYGYCLDAWLKEASLDVAIAELGMRSDLSKDWTEIVTAIFDTLGEPTEHKKLVVERLIHRQRWWIKTLVWTDDKRNRFMLDRYSGDARGAVDSWGCYGNPPFGDPYFAELKLPRIKELTQKIKDTVPKGEGFIASCEQSWLCAPKAFRYLEKLIHRIGVIGSSNPSGDNPILQCEDTYPNVDACRKWYAGFMSSLDAWLAGDLQDLPELGEITPVKHWLARILKHKLELYEKHANLGKLVRTKPSGKSGTKTI